MNVYGIFDNCVMGYITIFTERDDKVAERNFKIALTHERNMLKICRSKRTFVFLERLNYAINENF